MSTRRTYVAIAKAIREVLETANDDEQYGVIDCAQAIAIELGNENKRFEKQRFLVACGVIEEQNS